MKINNESALFFFLHEAASKRNGVNHSTHIKPKAIESLVDFRCIKMEL